MELDPDPNWAKILVPDPKSMYLDPQRCSCCKYEEKRCLSPLSLEGTGELIL